jgi:unspecific monooxygenase
MNFPVLDKFGSLIPCRVRARNTVKWFSAELEKCVTQGQDDQEFPKSGDLGTRLIAARDHGVLTQKQFRDNLNVLFVAGQENPQLLLISTLYLLAKHPVSVRHVSEVDFTNITGYPMLSEERSGSAWQGGSTRDRYQ